MEAILTVIIGMCIGTLITLTSVGSGIVMVPLLLHAGVSPMYALGSNFFFVLTVKTISAIRYYRVGEVDAHTLWRMLASAGVGLLAGLGMLWWLTSHYSHATVEGIIVWMLTIAILLSAGLYAANELTDLSSRVRGRYMIILAGLLTGFITQTTSVGSGVFILMLLGRHFKTASRLIGTNMVFSLLVSLLATLGYLSVGKVDLTLVVLLISGGLFGVLIGSRVGKLLSEYQHRALLTLMIALSVVLMLIKVIG
ncbi:MAG: sulfite exporter TauE/SafE family protein [Methermicoccaceae archaeon]